VLISRIVIAVLLFVPTSFAPTELKLLFKCGFEPLGDPQFNLAELELGQPCGPAVHQVAADAINECAGEAIGGHGVISSISNRSAGLSL